MDELARIIEALVFLSPDPVTKAALSEATSTDQESVERALVELSESYQPGKRGLLLREVAGGFTFATDPVAESAARELFAAVKIPALSPAQAETLAIIAYLQPASRPEIAQIRGVSVDTASAILLERGLIEEAGRSQFGAVLYRTTALFLKLFGLGSLQELPDVEQWDPSPQEVGELRERLLRAGSARGGQED